MQKRDETISKIDMLFDTLNRDKYTKYSVEELINIIESIIPVHATMEITNFDEVDMLLSIYPYLFQKLMKVYAYFIHEVRHRGADKNYVAQMRSYRDAFEQLMKAVKLNYDALSRRITLNIDRRG
jgi:hypothetical protein